MFKKFIEKEKADWKKRKNYKWSLLGNKGLDENGKEIEYKSTNRRLAEEKGW